VADGVGVADGLVAEGVPEVADECVPDVQVTEFPSAERTHTICDPLVDVVGEGVAVGEGGGIVVVTYRYVGLVIVTVRVAVGFLVTMRVDGTVVVVVTRVTFRVTVRVVVILRVVRVTTWRDAERFVDDVDEAFVLFAELVLDCPVEGV